MVDVNMHPINRPLLLVANEAEKFNANMKLTDPQIRETLRMTLVQLEEWTRKLQANVQRVTA
jgi:hypothetical protein